MLLVRHGQSFFNLHFNQTGNDPGIRDPELTEEGRAQARRTAESLKAQEIQRVECSPYRRAVQTAEIIADALKVPITGVTPLVGERAAYTCDYGSHPDELQQSWPHLRFDHLPPQWWAPHEESVEALKQRAQAFRTVTDPLADRDHLAVVSHWGFIHGLTGLSVTNCSVIRLHIRPTVRAELLHEGAPGHY